MELRAGDNEQVETVTLRVEGPFNRDAASRLRTRLEALHQAPVVLDFSRVGTFCDAAIDVLVRGLAAPRLQLRGLATHQERMFRYLGYGAPSQRPLPDFDA